ncbi:MAG: TetR/AcrR family transcriptional regulator [Lachnospiraceae bacterium]|nr:TetR/AcrR family transcriptional regulator [Lachnospiraceae bacterium]
MPPKAKFTREEIIEAAMQIVREEGMEAVTSREIGRRLQSSACPIFTVFRNMDEVNTALLAAIRSLYREYIREGLAQKLAFQGVGTAYIKFARNEPKFFRLLFMTEPENPTDIGHILSVIDENYAEILRSVKDPYRLTTKEADRLYQHLWVYTHGIATLCATKVCTFTDEEIQERMKEIFISLRNNMDAQRADQAAP